MSSLKFSVSRQEALLIMITMFWGGTFLAVQYAVSLSGPLFFVGLRFATAALAVGLLSLRTLRGLTWLEVKAGVAIGVAIALGYGLQTWGLQTISSSKSAFITRDVCAAGAAAAVAVPGTYAGGDVLRGDCAGLYWF
ncbi:putative transmembrane protein [Klebsiella pneumoniae]|uniref:Putative transmembrane protein n=1 Tax=Klebsiella pneumoniae TaxID=573 RepID=A0A3S4GU57_KLEPN|nr:putative transmembrane protein [Klebsiella pneumoniae]